MVLSNDILLLDGENMGIEKEYNKEIEQIAKDKNFRRINHFVMDHTYSLCTNNEKYRKEIDNTNKASYMVKQEDDLNVKPDGKTTNIIVSKKRTYEAAKAYNGKKIAVLNFANNHSIGGAPWSAGAQEESLCRISTLYPCLEKFKKDFELEINYILKVNFEDCWKRLLNNETELVVASDFIKENKLQEFNQDNDRF